jgi:hypothetical protein
MEIENQQSALSDNLVASKIYHLRDKKVMIDRDLAELYEVETRALNQAVSRNIERFPEIFMFQLTQIEFEILMSQFVTSRWGGTRNCLMHLQSRELQCSQVF